MHSSISTTPDTLDPTTLMKTQVPTTLLSLTNSLAAGPARSAQKRSAQKKKSYSMIRRTSALLFAAVCSLGSTGAAQSWALEIKDDGLLDFPWHPVMNTDSTVTMEGWFRQVGPMSRQIAYIRYQGSAEHKELVIDEAGRLRWLYAGQPWAHSGPCRETDPGMFPANGQWHHFAYSRHADHTWEVYLDGEVVHSGGPSGCCWLTCDVINASAPTWISGATGMQLRAFRVSEVDRYSGPFTPQEQWTSDADTVLLLPFEEGAGNVIFDHSPAAQTGTIGGEFEWVDLAAECTAGNFCIGAPNSAGSGASLAMSGSTGVADNDFTLVTSGASLNSPGLFVYAAVQAEEPFGDGFRCVGTGPTGVFRLSPTLFTDANGGAVRLVDLTQGATSSGPGAITAGSTWNFQFWYRDLAGGGQGFNATDGLQVIFCP
jgi:hypothetical protein